MSKQAVKVRVQSAVPRNCNIPNAFATCAQCLTRCWSIHTQQCCDQGARRCLREHGASSKHVVVILSTVIDHFILRIT